MMKKNILLACCFLFSVLFSEAQTKPTSVTNSVNTELSKLLTGTGLPFKMINDSVSVIPYAGANIKTYNVVVQKINELIIIYTDLMEILPGTITEKTYKYLLQQTDHFDIVKIGMSSDEQSVFVRADLYKTGITSPLLGRVIKQVANVTNIIAGEIQ
jgi:hypothetical protein